ncbi:conserved hypothetical protein [Candidatus Desulfarcum epimagneticum]|uniref:Glycosyltransferase 2-like domain-containing protein n=1 Tax=uncultured Desulfobacteraceae bacterium TaxID=218296 RepID=A0A484HN71_9BACT|nr:conserved hypothetical protein [uncultured Desulfobacteraceae bacterium]
MNISLKRPVKNSNEFVSVIICTHNRRHLLERALNALAAQSAPFDMFETLVVDDGSNDGAGMICEEMAKRLPNLRLLTLARNTGKSNAANIGVKSATGDFLVFTDDDCLPHRDWIKNMTRALHLFPVVAGAVSAPDSGYVSLCHNISEFHPFIPGGKSKKACFIAGANMGIRRAVWEEAGKFEKNRALCFDMEFILRIRSKGYEPRFVSDAVVSHDHDRKTFKSIFQYAVRHASETILLRHKYSSLLNTPFILKSPFLLILTSPVIAFKTTLEIYLKNFKLMKWTHAMPTVYFLKMAWALGAARGLSHVKTKK